MGDLAVQIAKKIVKEKISAEDKKRLLDDAQEVVKETA